MGFKMKGFSGFKDYASTSSATSQKIADAKEAERSASIDTQKANCKCGQAQCQCGETPTKWVALAAKAAGALIGANKRRQASKDAADAAKGKAVQDVLSKKIS